MIQENSGKKGCSVALEDLRYLQINTETSRGRLKMGELMVHKDTSSRILKIREVNPTYL